MPKKNYYAVKVGKSGHAVYESWAECEKNVKGYSGAEYQSFKSIEQANAFAAPAAPSAPDPPQRPPSKLKRGRLRKERKEASYKEGVDPMKNFVDLTADSSPVGEEQGATKRRSAASSG